MGLRIPKTCRDSPKTQRTDKTGTNRNSQRKDRTAPSKPAKETVASEEEQILMQVNKYELTTKFMGGILNYFLKTGKK